MSGKVYGICMTYNAVDIIRSLIDNVVNQEFNGLVILDNFSNDGTREILEEKVKEFEDGPFELRVLYDKCRAFFKAKKMNSLGALAHSLAWHHSSRYAGKTWIVPMDQDEIWTTSRAGYSLGEYLRMHMGVVGYWNYMRNYITTSLDNPDEPDPVKRMKYYLSANDPRQQIKNEKSCYIFDDIVYSPSGHHHVIVKSVGQVRVPRVDWLVIKHYPYRSLEQVKEKYSQLYYAVHLQGDKVPADQDRHVKERGVYNDLQFKTFWENECVSKDPDKEGLILDKEA